MTAGTLRSLLGGEISVLRGIKGFTSPIFLMAPCRVLGICEGASNAHRLCVGMITRQVSRRQRLDKLQRDGAVSSPGTEAACNAGK